MNEATKIYLSNLPKVVRVYQEKPSQDGFIAILDTKEKVIISRTEWETQGNIQSVEDATLFKTSKGDIIFDEPQVKQIQSHFVHSS